MSKGNLFLGQARGSVGDVTFTHIDGQQVARARNRSPRNPRVPSQMLQRIVLNSASKAYSLMQAIVDHSFEGVNGRARNQQRYMMLNTALLRNKLADVIADPTEANALASEAISYSFKGDFNPQLNAWVLSEGTLPAQIVESVDGSPSNFRLRCVSNLAEVFSYADVIEALGIQAGDQLTFIGCGHQYGREDNSDNIDAFAYARIIMEPASGDFDIAFIDSESDYVLDPNPKNEGAVRLSIGEDAAGPYIDFWFPQFQSQVSEVNPTMVGGAVILSRFESGRWRRSPQSIVLANFGGSLPPLDIATFGAAYASYLTGDSSNLYLNGSPVGRAAARAAGGEAVVTSVIVDDETISPGTARSGVANSAVRVVGTGLSTSNVQVVNGTSLEPVGWSSVSDTEMISDECQTSEGESWIIKVNGSFYASFSG